MDVTEITDVTVSDQKKTPTNNKDDGVLFRAKSVTSETTETEDYKGHLEKKKSS